MKVKLDENLPLRLRDALRLLGHDADTVPDEGLGGRDDESVWRAAQAEGRFLVTQDLDFSDIDRFQPGTHAGVMLVRLREPSANVLLARITNAFQQDDAEHWRGCFVVLGERKLRVRRPA